MKPYYSAFHPGMQFIRARGGGTGAAVAARGAGESCGISPVQDSAHRGPHSRPGVKADKGGTV